MNSLNATRHGGDRQTTWQAICLQASQYQAMTLSWSWYNILWNCLGTSHLVQVWSINPEPICQNTAVEKHHFSTFHTWKKANVLKIQRLIYSADVPCLLYDEFSTCSCSAGKHKEAASQRSMGQKKADNQLMYWKESQQDKKIRKATCYTTGQAPLANLKSDEVGRADGFSHVQTC